MDFGSRAYHRMWEARAKHAQNMPKRQALYSGGYGNCFVRHAHLPRSIWAARVVWGRWEEEDLKVMVDVVKCPGCCDGPYKTTITSTDRHGLTMPGLMNTVSRSYSLELNEQLAWADECSSQRIALGDYGDYAQGNLVRAGNIFEDMRAAGINLDDASTYGPAVSRVSSRGIGILLDWIENQDDRAVAYHTWGTHLALHQPKAISLPANEHFSLLLKALSIRLAGKYLVTTVVQCSDFYVISRGSNRRDPGGDSTPDNGNHSTEAGIFTPLCTIASPQAWRREVLRTQTKKRLRVIREQFYALVDMHQRRFEPSHEFTKKSIAIKFFEDLFALEYLQNYVPLHNGSLSSR
ncbi:hypothetical protein EDD15DRAFT_2236520 [Pisolithus albus]|nr:hypothetical protein EDD15DRAFT_2236520 [Pisolithus albus]